MIDEKVLIEWLLGKKYITIDENSLEMTEEFEKQHQWELSRNCFINSVVKHINEQPKVGEWIPVSERLPDKPESGEEHGYLIQDEIIIEPYNAWWDGEKFIDVTDKELRYVIAWMPLPEPYKGE